MSSIHPCSGKETSWTLSTMIRPKLSLLQPLHPTMNRLIIYTITHSSSNRTLHFTTHSSSNRTLHISFSVSNSSCARPSRNAFVLSRPSSSGRGVTRFTREWTWITLRFSPAVSVPRFMIQVQIRIFKFKLEFSSNPLSKHDWRTHNRLTYVPRASFSWVKKHMEPIHLFILYFSQHRNEAYICTSIVDALLSTYLGAICTSIDPLELYPSFAPFAPLLMHLNWIQVRMRRRIKSTWRCTSTNCTKGYRNRLLPKKESVDLGTRCTGKTPSKRRNQ